MRSASINPATYYDKSAVRELLGISGQSLNKACRTGELAFSDRGGRRFFRGDWLIAWLDGSRPTTPGEERQNGQRTTQEKPPSESRLT